MASRSNFKRNTEKRSLRAATEAAAAEQKAGGIMRTLNTPRSTVEVQNVEPATIPDQDSDTESLNSNTGLLDSGDVGVDEVGKLEGDHELHQQLLDTLRECSRQRLRALQMALRKHGNNEARITSQELHQVFQENQIRISARGFQMLVDAFKDIHGIDYETMLMALVTAQESTGRDSVLAQNKKSGMSKERRRINQEEQDTDLLDRLEHQFSKFEETHDMGEIRETFKSKDQDKRGRLQREDVIYLCNDLNLPVYGALLAALLNRCDDDNNGDISWPELMSFLEKSYQNMEDRKREERLSKLSKQQGKPRSRLKRKNSSMQLFYRELAATKARQAKLLEKVQSGSHKPTTSDRSGSKKATMDRKDSDKLEQKKKGEEQGESAGKITQSALASNPDKPDDASVVTDPNQVRNSGAATTRATRSSKQIGKKTVEMEIKQKNFVFYAPDNFKDNSVNTDPPKERLKLEWVYGYRGNDCRNNIHISNTGEIIYFIGTVVILYKKDQHKQRHYREHTQEIKSLAVHPKGMTAASGQNASPENEDIKASVRSLSSKSKHSQASEEKLCAVDESDGQSLSVWNIATGKLIAQSQLGLEVTCGVDFTPQSSNTILVVGKEHIGWWSINQDKGTVILKTKAEYQSHLRAKYVICLLHNDKGDLITGDSNGTVYVWGNGGNKITNIIKHAHDGPVFSLLVTRGHLLTAGRDGFVYSWMWTKNMDQSGKLEIPLVEGGVRMIQIYRETLLIGTTTNSILTATLAGQALKNPLSGVSLNQIAFTQGHYDSVQGLCTVQDPDRPGLMVTAAKDGHICMFDTVQRKPLWKQSLLGIQAIAVDINKKGNLIVIGTNTSVILLSAKFNDEKRVRFEEIKRLRITKQKLTTVKLSPDGQRLAAGDSDGDICIAGLKPADTEALHWGVFGHCKGHVGSITALDWSKDKYQNNYIIRTSSSSIELLYWNTENQTKIKSVADLRNIRWASFACQLGYDVAGVWHSKQAQEAGITTLDVNAKGTLVAMGDNIGYLSLFRAPCSKPGASSHTNKSHTHVMNVAFTKSSHHVITIGGEDMSIVQWLVK